MSELLNDLKINFFPRVGFIPKSAANSKPTPISLFVTVNKQPRIRIPGIGKVAPEDWITESQRVKVPRAIKDEKKRIIAERINANIDKAEKAVKDVFKEYTTRYNEYPADLEEFKENIERRIKGLPDIEEKTEAPKTDSFLEYMQSFIDEADEEITNPPLRTFIKNFRKQRYKKRNITAWRSYLKVFKEFCKTTKRADLKFNDINLSFYKSFENYMAKKEVSANYFGAYIKTVKKFMGEAEKDRLHDNKEYLNKDFLKTKAPADGKALTIDQLRSIAHYDFSDNPIYDNARDLFLVGCWTGLRFSDYSRLNKSHISADGILDIKASKQEDEVAVPILPELQKIIDKYKGSDTGFPERIPDSDLNEYIKEICKLVGEKIDKSFLAIHTKETILASGEIKVESEPLYKFISTHVGRRSFCTNAIMMGIPSEFVKKISGHKSDAAFWAYVKMKPRDSSKLALKAFISNNQELEVAHG